MNLNEALNTILNIHGRSNSPDTLYVGESRSKYVINGEVVSVEHEEPSRDSTACNLDALISYVMEDSCIWHRDNCVVLVVSDSDPLDFNVVNWNLTESSKYACLGRDAQQARDPKLFVQFIVQNLRDEFERDAPGLLGQLRTLKFSSTDDQSSEITHGRESMGRDINLQLANASDLPETVTLNIRRWAELEIFVKVESMLKVDLETRKISLTPLADSMVAANLDAHEQLSDLISSEVKCRVLHGSP